MKKCISVRLEDWQDEGFLRVAKLQGVTPTELLRQLVVQCINNETAIENFAAKEGAENKILLTSIADRVIEDGDKAEKFLKRIESLVAGHLHYSIKVAKGERSEFIETLKIGKAVVKQLNEKESEGE